MNNPAEQGDMEEILSSIRSTLEEETGKVAKESAAKKPADSAAAEEAKPEESAEVAGDALASDEGDVLDLSEVEMVEDVVPADDAAEESDAKEAEGAGEVDSGGTTEEIFDIEAFASGGQERKLSGEEVEKVKKEDRLGENDVIEEIDVEAAEAAAEEEKAEPVAATQASDDFDRLLAELQDEEGAGGDTPVEATPAAADAEPEAAPAQEDAAVAEDVAAAVTPTPEAAAEVPAEPAEAVPDEPAPTAPAASSPRPQETPMPVSSTRVQMPIIPGSTGLQVALPAEVLAEALRPLIKDWVAENLPGVVEKLVADEIEKLVKG